VPQTPSVLADLSVEDNLRAYAALAPSFSRARGEELVDVLGLSDKRKVRASALSGGERRKLEIVRALGASPEVLVCDEPFAALDPAGKKKAGGLLRAAADAGASVLLADHDVREALPLCDRALLLLAGRIACDASPEAFSKDPVVVAHYIALS
jgi:lipopolysaccharide export system ATP-binding protein